MRFSVGYPSNVNDGFVSHIIESKEALYEVYFAFGDIPNGRSPQNSARTLPWEKTERQLCDLGRFTSAGIELNLLLNGNCYGEDSLSRAFFLSLGDTVDYLASRFSLSSVTTASPVIAKFIKTNFDGLSTRASVNMGIGSTQAMDYVSEYFSGYYLKREYNRDFARIEEAREWCADNGKELYMLANSGCLNECSARTFHDNLVSHEAKITKMDNAYEFPGICRAYLSKSGKKISFIRDMNYVRPEDIHLYEGYFTAAKLATRVNSSPERLLDAYLSAKYSGAVTDLLEPDNGSAILPEVIENSLFPPDFGEKISHCAKNCAVCGYCAEVLGKTLHDLGDSMTAIQ